LPGDLKIYSTLAREKLDFRPRKSGEVSMYVCGPTVYDEPHLGHARSVLSFDIVRRYLEYRGFQVTFVMNYTDVDDKIIDRARHEGTSAKAIAEKYIAVWDAHMATLGVKRPTVAPRATEHIDGMIELVEELIEGGHAYAANGDVYFSIQSFPSYGELSGKNIEELQAGARVEPGEHKKHPLDFALWKATEDDPRWESPWGWGRPGWHIECSVMSLRYLGPGFDIHGGGQDLIFPHHENERAQAEAAGKAFARYWIHTGLVNLAGEKMAKSTGNFITLSEALRRYKPDTLRMLALRSHYRSPVDFGPEEMEQARAAVERLEEFTRRAKRYLGESLDLSAANDLEPREEADKVALPHLRRFVMAMDDDFNTPQALAALYDAVRAGNQAIDEGVESRIVASLYSAVREMAGSFGLSLEEQSRVGSSETEKTLEALVETVLELRESLRRAKMFSEADAARKRLEELGIVVEDTPKGPVWHWRE
jgi:cysteinyl-tRNA synthetase